MFVDSRVKETTSVTGTGSATLAGAATGFVSFNTAYGLNQPFPYVIGSSGGAEWEEGVGYLSGSTTLVRERVTRSSNGNALVNFSAGTKDIFSSIHVDMAANAVLGNQLLVNKAQGWN